MFSGGLTMSKNLDYVLLLDFYSELLTDKQKDIMELYYYEDLSLSEIAEHEKITRQGVHDTIKRSELFLSDIEKKLSLVSKVTSYKNLIGEIKKIAVNINDENNKYGYSRNISEYLKEMMTFIEENEKLI